MVWTAFNCTGPPEGTRIVGGLPYRSTADIVWPCLATLVACTYTVLHLNVIASDGVTEEEPKVGWWSDLWRGVKSKSRTHGVELAVAIWAVLVPEMICYAALKEWVAARRLKKSLVDHQQAKKDNHPTRGIPPYYWTKTHAHYIMMGGMRLCCSKPNPVDKICNCKEIMLDSESYLGLVERGILPCYPPISKAEVLDHSKSGVFARILAAFQVLWFAATIFLRLGRHLPVSQLEVGVAGYVLLTLFTYYWYWKKLKSVECGTRVYPIPTADSLGCGRPLLDRFGHVRGFAAQGLRLEGRTQSFFSEFLHQIGHQFHEFYKVEGNILAFIFLACLFVACGAVHVAAWRSTFPGPVDLWLWRIAALITTALPLCLLPSPYLLQTFGSPAKPFPSGLSLLRSCAPILLYVVGCVVYILARVILLVEMCRCLFYLPREAFVNTWTSNLPHVG